MRIWTIGHGRRPIEDLVATLQSARIRTVADVRTVPGSRRHPQFGKAPLRDSLAAVGIAYVHLPGLGGRREPRTDSPHTALRVDAFRGYADHMSSDEFQRDLAVLVERATAAPTAFMCAETNWSECHRRMLADLLTVRGWDVTHLLAASESEAHQMWSAARVANGTLVYDAGTLPLPPA
jgi:uncharacterized protein (DUF488 family)